MNPDVPPEVEMRPVVEAHRFVMDISRIKADLGFSPTPLRAWLTETIRWHLDGGLTGSPGYERRSDELALAARYR